ncbi:MAG: hypothetical protein M3032_13370, partial [Verrucomicrobiota bacterium]|nr:hypothetical protein [Verrucomicrobiota bacterium]
MSHFEIRDFQSSDADDVNRVAALAFAEFENAYGEWEPIATSISKTAELAETGELIVAVVA